MKTNLILAIIAVVLAIPTFFTWRGDRTQFTDYEAIPKLFDGFTPDAVRFVVIAKPKLQDGKVVKNEKGELETEKLILQKVDDRWRVRGGEMEGVPALTTKVETDVLDHLKRMRIDDKTSSKDVTPEDLKLRDLTQEQGTLIQCLDANQHPVAELVLGKDASGGKWGEDVVKGFFVRRKDKNEVVLYDANEAQYWTMSIKPDDWIDKNLHQYSEAKVKKFAVKNPKGEIAFEKEKATPDPKAGAPSVDKWKAVNPPPETGAVKQQEVTNLVSRFARLDAARFQGRLAEVKDQAALGLQQPEFVIEATLEDGTVHRLEVGKKIADKQEYHAHVNGKDFADFLVSVHDFIVSGFEKEPKEFFDPPAPATQPNEPQKDPASKPNTEPATKPGK